MRTGHESLEEGVPTSSLWSGKRAGNYGSREAYHLIFYFLSEDISALFCERERTIKYFYFLYGGHDCCRLLCILQKEILLCGCPLATAGPTDIACFLYIVIPTRFFSRVHCPSRLPTIFHATGRSRRLSPTHPKIHSLYLLAPASHYVWRPVLEARNCPGS